MIAPVVRVVSGGHPEFAPLIDESTMENYLASDEKFQKEGAVLSLFGGGRLMGNTTVADKPEDGCGVILASRPPLSTVAVNTPVSSHADTRAQASRTEVSLFKRLTSRWLIDAGFDRSRVRTAQVSPIVSTQLRVSVGRALIGRVDVRAKNVTHRLFAIVETEPKGARVTLADLQTEQDVFGTDTLQRSYVDQLDLDGDGQDEVITKQTYYEWWAYSVFVWDKGRDSWDHRYTGGGCSP